MRFRDELIALLDPRFYTASWLECQIYNGAIRTLESENAIILYELKRYPTGWLELIGLAAAGDLAEIKDILIPNAEVIAKNLGCKSAEISSRPAWARLMEDAGYQQYQVAIKKEF